MGLWLKIHHLRYWQGNGEDKIFYRHLILIYLLQHHIRFHTKTSRETSSSSRASYIKRWGDCYLLGIPTEMGGGGGGRRWVRLKVVFQPQMVKKPTAIWIRWCMQVSQRNGNLPHESPQQPVPTKQSHSPFLFLKQNGPIGFQNSNTNCICAHQWFRISRRDEFLFRITPARVRKLKKTPSFSFWDKNPGRFFQLGQIPKKVPQSVSSKRRDFSPSS